MVMSNGALATIQPDAGAIMEAVIAKGDLAGLKPEERARYYMRVCESVGVNPLTQPFAYIVLNGKLTLYALRTCTDQLRQNNGVSITRTEAETIDGVRIVTAYARDKSGREDSDIGAVNVKGLQGDALANAYMKALTKAKRRVTLSICGLGFLDESEIETVPSARIVPVDTATGEIIEEMPRTRAVAAQDASNDPNPMTDAQKRKIWAMAQDLGMDVDKLHAFAEVDSLSSLSKVQASELIDRLDAALGALIDASQAGEQA